MKKNHHHMHQFLLSIIAVVIVVCTQQYSRAGLQPEHMTTQGLNLLASGSSAGTEFYLTFLPNIDEASGYNKAVIYVVATTKTLVRVSVDSKGYVSSKYTVPYGIISFELDMGVAQPLKRSRTKRPDAEAKYDGCGIHVTSDAPVVVYGVSRVRFTSDSFLGVPVHALGKEYIIASMPDMSWMYAQHYLPSECAIVAAYDNTKIDFTLGGNSVTFTPGGLKSGQTKSVYLNRGDVWFVATSGDSKEGDLSGSRIVATKPVAVFSGNQCANVPTPVQFCDFITEMELPLNMWGREYHVPRFTQRANSYMMKIFAAQPNTSVYNNGSFWKNIQTAGGVEGSGYVYQRVDGSGNRIGSFTGQKPIGITVFNPGSSDDQNGIDPYQMIVVPAEQYQKELVFSTPGSKGGIGFPMNLLGIVFPIDSNGSMPSDLEFGVATNGQFSWRSFASAFGSSFKPADVFGNKAFGHSYAFKEVTLPSDGVYALRCSVPLMGYLYGGSEFDSYGHPAGCAMRVNSTDVVAPVPTFSVACDGSVGVASVARIVDLPSDNTQRSNLSTITLDPSVSFNYVLSTDAFIPGEAQQTQWRLNVVDLLQDAFARVHFSDRAGNDTIIDVQYTTPNIRIEKSDLDFGVVSAGSYVIDSTTLHLVNRSSAPQDVLKLDFKSGSSSPFHVLAPSLPLRLQPGEVKAIVIAFDARESAQDLLKDSIGLECACFHTFQHLVKGVVAAPIINVSSPQNFGGVMVGTTSAPRYVQVRNEGKVRLTISNHSGLQPDDGVFDISEVKADDIRAAHPLVLEASGNAQAQKTYSVRFTPTSVRNYHATLTFSSDAHLIDSTWIFDGHGIDAGLTTNVVDFGRNRIRKGPYTRENSGAGSPAAIVLVNSGTSPVRVQSCTRLSDPAQAAHFRFDESLLPAIIDVGDTLSIPVEYIPSQLAYDTLQLAVLTDDPTIRPVFTATGIGTAPKIQINDVDFGVLHPAAGDKSATRILDVLSLDQTTTPRWDFFDLSPVTITDFTSKIDSMGEEEISTDSATVGSQRFIFIKQGFALPILIEHGQRSQAMTCVYTPDAALGSSMNQSVLSTVSDAVEEAHSTLKGQSENDALTSSIIVDGSSVCTGTQINLALHITNTSTTPTTISHISSFTVVQGDATLFALPQVNQQLNIAPGATKVVNLQFTPATPGTHDGQIELVLQPGNVHVVSNSFNVQAISNTLAQLSLVGDNGSSSIPISLNTKGESDFVTVHIRLANDISTSSSHALHAELHYEAAALVPRMLDNERVDVRLNTIDGALRDWNLKASRRLGVEGIIDLEAWSANGIHTVTDKDICTLSFMLVNARPDVLNHIQNLTLQLQSARLFTDEQGTQPNTCDNVSASDATVVGEAACVSSLTQIVYSGVTTALHSITPNPVPASNPFTVSFALGIESFVAIDLVNADGDVVETVLHQNMKSGHYTVTNPSTSLPSGYYTLRLRTDTETRVQPVVIVR